MAKRRTFTVCGQLFKTKKSLEKEAKRIRDSQTLGLPLAPNDRTFIEEVFRQLYPEKEYEAKGLDTGIRAVTVISIMGGRCFRFLLNDGRSQEPSLRVCFQPSLAKSAPTARATFRYEVFRDCVAYRDLYFAQYGGVTAPCELTGESITVAECEIDHVPPNTFQVILDAYLQAQDLSLETVQTREPLNGIGEVLADRAQASDWRAFHLSQATFRVLSKRVHVEETRQQLKKPPLREPDITKAELDAMFAD